jgi:hypothetical protein
MLDIIKFRSGHDHTDANTKVSERINRAVARSIPITPPVYTNARVVAGAKNRKVMAGQARPFFVNPSKERNDGARADR